MYLTDVCVQKNFQRIAEISVGGSVRKALILSYGTSYMYVLLYYVLFVFVLCIIVYCAKCKPPLPLNPEPEPEL